MGLLTQSGVLVGEVKEMIGKAPCSVKRGGLELRGLNAFLESHEWKENVNDRMSRVQLGRDRAVDRV